MKITTHVSDLDGKTPGAEPHTIALDDQVWEIDLLPSEWELVSRALAKFLKVARPAEGSMVSTPDATSETTRPPAKPGSARSTGKPARSSSTSPAKKTTTPRRRRGQPQVPGVDIAEVRAFLRAAGEQVADRGKLRAEQIERFLAATGGKKDSSAD